jgi:hypothetical protein
MLDHLTEPDRHTKPKRDRITVRLDRALPPIPSDRKPAVPIVPDGPSPDRTVPIGAFHHLGQKPLDLHRMNHRVNNQRLGDERSGHRSPNAHSRPDREPPHPAAPG